MVVDIRKFLCSVNGLAHILLTSEAEWNWKFESDLYQTNQSEIPSEYRSQTRFLWALQLCKISGEFMNV